MPITVSPTKMSASDPKRIGGVWSFISRFNALVDWIISLSPSGATQYDTDEITYVPAAGAVAQTCAYSRIGKNVYLSGGLTPTGVTASTWTTLVTLPSELRPSGMRYLSASIVGSTTKADLRVQATGEVQLWIAATTSATVGLNTSFRVA